jgi:hypothetical protein
LGEIKGEVLGVMGTETALDFKQYSILKGAGKGLRSLSEQ